MTGFTVKHNKFEGPLEVLLNLIERRQLHIGDITLATVTDDFLNYLQSFPEFPIAESAQFTYIASTLLLIKSKALLPELSLSKEEEESIEELQHRLKLLHRFRELSRHVRMRFGQAPSYLPIGREQAPVFAPPKGLSLTHMLQSIRSVLAAVPRPEALAHTVVKKVISLEQMIESLKDRIVRALRMSFREFSGAGKSERVHPNNFSAEDEKVARVNIIVGFLAMLELVKQGLITADQDEPHGDIVMETGSVDVPRY